MDTKVVIELFVAGLIDRTEARSLLQNQCDIDLNFCTNQRDALLCKIKMLANNSCAVISRESRLNAIYELVKEL